MALLAVSIPSDLSERPLITKLQEISSDLSLNLIVAL
jgi:hypothetical protein